LHEYETIFIIDSLLKSEELDGIINKYERFISANGGQIQRIDRWGKKRLAYEIKKRQYGYYVYVRYNGPPTIVKPLEREFRLNESILRYLTIRLDKKMLKEEQRKEIQTKSEVLEPSFLKKDDESKLEFEVIKYPDTIEGEDETDVGSESYEERIEIYQDERKEQPSSETAAEVIG